ncbi:LacI family DNA-binding transcriptional regulator [Streptomyces sp. NPDC048603]|uniref:LacI family DNA-binding transcriptional regulator n=1 Tax=Streptomyces sp. NPDC048603 TaxID=3365577 RepID=UPI00371E5FED
MDGGRGRAGRRPTLEEVALRAGVGRGTASRVINGSARVSEHSRAVVEAAVAELGYVPNPAARALAAHRTDSVALVVPGHEDRSCGERDFHELILGVAGALAESGMRLLLTLAGSDQERRRAARYLAAHRVDGVLLVSSCPGDPLPGLLAGMGIPVVADGRRSAGEDLPCVDFDHLAGGRAATGHLLAHGRRSIAAISGPPGDYASGCRLEGYRQALRAAGFTPDGQLTEAGDGSEEGGGRAMRALLSRRPGLDAVFAASDAMAAGAGRELRAAGRRIPEDVALVGFGDSVVARHLDPPLTSVRQPVRDMGREMVRALLARIAGTGEPGAVVLPTELVVRESA